MRRALAIMVLSIAALMLWPSEPNPVGSVSALSGPTALVAGEALTVTAEAEPNESVITISAISGLTVHELTATVIDGRALVSIPTALTETAGRLTLYAGSSQLEIDIAPGPAASPVRALVGPRTIVADGIDHTLAVAAPGDEYGNAIANGTSVSFTRRNPEGDLETITHPTEIGVSWAPFTAGTIAGPADLWVTVDGASGTAATITEVPGRATAPSLVPPEQLLSADGRSTITLETTPISDDFDNLLLDGIDASFQIDTDEGRSLVPAVIENGRLRAMWVVPDHPSTVTIRALVNGRTTKPMSLTFDSAVSSFEASARAGSDGVVVEVGPVLGPHGAFVADGTPVTIGDAVVALIDGRAQATLPGDHNTVTVEVLGAVEIIEVAP